MHIYCDESGGVGRGVMTLAAVGVDPDAADALLDRFREVTGLRSELKGSRIDIGERAYFFELLERSGARAVVSIAISMLKAAPGEDRGDRDREVYADLLNDAVGALLPETGGCARIVIDDGRYDPATLQALTGEIAGLVGHLGAARREMSHREAGLQIADVIANSFFNRALPSARQARISAILEPFLESGRIRMHVLGAPVPG